jgi:NAD-dependent dihydropyrimidine dehydrogenase PreA subunit
MFKQIFNIFLKRGNNKSLGPSLDTILEEVDSHIEGIGNLIRPAPEAKPRTPFNTDLPREKISMMNLTAQQRMRVMPKMMPLMVNMQRGARMYDKPFESTQTEATPEFIAQLEALMLAAGAKDIGYVNVPRNAIFQGKGIPCKHAIVFTVEMDKEPISTAPSLDCQIEVMNGYKRMSIISAKISRFIRKHGFAAYPGMALGGLTDYVHLAELAGLGAIGYHGLLISPREGARLRINTIYTNITNLPTLASLGKENEHLWVRDFCSMCQKCVRKCPVNAIYEQPRLRGDGGMQCIDQAACRDYFTSNYGCAICLAVCPFSQAGYDKVKAGFKGNHEAPQFRIPIEIREPVYQAQ